MRLVCPNCSAQYEIDGSMIPDGGRDVQCSNCGHTWFELPPAETFGEDAPEDFVDEIIADSREETADAAVEDSTDSPAEDGPAEPDTADTADDVDADEKPDDPEDDDDADTLSPSSAVAAAASAALAGGVSEQPTAEPPRTQRRPADAAALDILREEAEREMSRRAAPSTPIETQTDLGLDEIQRRRTPSRALRARMAAMGEEDEQDTEKKEAPAGATRLADAPSYPPTSPDDDDGYKKPQRDVLPDIDEINSTLKPAGRDGSRGRSGFLAGFLIMVLAAAALIFGYAQAPAIAKAFPNAEPTLIAYVDRANAFRDWVGALLGG